MGEIATGSRRRDARLGDQAVPVYVVTLGAGPELVAVESGLARSLGVSVGELVDAIGQDGRVTFWARDLARLTTGRSIAVLRARVERSFALEPEPVRRILRGIRELRVPASGGGVGGAA